MKKSILRFGALALMSMMSIGVWAQTFVENGNVYEVSDKDNKTVALVSASKAMPSDGKVTYDKVEYTITKINDYAYLNTSVESGVTIPGSVTVVGASALKGQKINNTEFPAFTSIGEAAFYGATFSKPNAMFAIGCNLPKGAFHNAQFGAGTRIKLSNPNLTSLEDEVFCLDAPNASDGLVYVELPFACVGSFNKVGKSAFKNRGQLIGFGYYSAPLYLLPLALETVGESAFEGCKDLEFYFYEHAEYNGIRNVGKSAFSGCKKLDNAMFANICKSFEGLSFAEGSFKDCSLTNVDLSKWTTINALALDTDKDNKTPDEQFKGIPAFAFSGNPITTLKYPANLQAIGNGAFKGNRLATISLPEGLLYVGENALESANNTEAIGEATPAVKFSQTVLNLPKSLKTIFAGGIDNRKITNICAYPTLMDNNGTYIPTIDTHTTLDATLIVPAIAPTKNSDASIVTSKSLYDAAGWNKDKITWTEESSATFSIKYPTYNGAMSISYDNVIYNVKKNQNVPEVDDEYGYYTAEVKSIESRSSAIFYGFFEAKSDGDVITVDDGDDKTKDYEYKAVFMARFPTDKTVASNTDHAITIEPNSGNTDLATGFAQFFKDDQTFTKYTLPVDAFKEDKNLTSVTFGTGITAIPNKAFYGCTKLSTVNFDTNAATEGVQSEITSIGEYAFAGTTKLESIDLPSGLTSVGAGAFSDLAESTGVDARPAGLKSVTLPNTLEEIDENAFAAESIEKVYVSYASVPELSADPFAYVSDEDQDHYKADLIVTNGKYARSAYLDGDCWQKFFKNGGDYSTTTFVEVVAAPTQSDQNATAEKLVCADENGVFHFADEVKAVKVETQIGTPASEGVVAEPVKVSYSRDLTEGLWNPISLPFDVKASDIKDAEVAELYNVRLNPETGALEAVVWVKLKDADIMKARTPYVIKPAEGKGTGWAVNTSSIIETTFSGNKYQSSSVNCMSTKEEYIIQSNFETVASLKDVSGYYISRSGFSYDNTTVGVSLKPYRFYLTRKDRTDSDKLIYGPWTKEETSSVKVVVLDDEEEAATYINSLSVRDAENLSAPMYDITGRQIVSPVKGQVYIQNGVKKLAK